jgi:hypothetical protein
MNPTFDRLYRQLGKVTFGLLVTTLAAYGLTLVCALLGFSHAVSSLGGVAASLAFVFGILLILFLVTSIVSAVLRWVERRDQFKGS